MFIVFLKHYEINLNRISKLNIITYLLKLKYLLKLLIYLNFT